MFRWLMIGSFLLLGSTLTLALSQNAKGTRYAFLVSCGKYDATQLKELPYTNAEMAEFRQVLLDSGYAASDIIHLKDVGGASRIASGRNILKQLDLILGEISEPEDSIVLAFNGHGVQFKGDQAGYFCPIDADLTDRRTLIPTEEIFKRLSKCKAKQKVLLVNACRNDPAQFPNQAANRIDLEAGNKDVIPDGIAALYSCKDQQLSYYYPETGEYKNRKRSLFFHHLIETWKSARTDDDFTVDQLFTLVRKKTSTDARLIFNQSQTPEIRRKVEGIGEWKLIARKEIVKRPEMKQAKELTFDLGNGVKLEMVRIPKGKFLMGSPKNEEGRDDNESPQHEVTLKKDFYLGKYEVTRGQFRRFVESESYKTEAELDGKGSVGWDEASEDFKQDKKYNWKNAGFEQSDDHPVVNVSWNDAVKYCEWLSKKEGKRFRLPTEAEWEYSSRARILNRFSFGDDEEDLAKHGNVADGTAKEKYPKWDKAIRAKDGYIYTSPVGRFGVNVFGLHDIYGNVWEWCGDWYGEYSTESVSDPSGPSSGSGRVYRGGSWNSHPLLCRSAVRGADLPSFRGGYLGFRLAFTPSE
jgi:formylglycine-generating enzyme required for sulfatase activity